MKNKITKIERIVAKKTINTKDRAIEKEFLKLVKEFAQVISENFGEDKLKVFYKNLKKFNFKVEDVDINLMNKKSSGQVDLKSKEFEIKSLNSVFHELLHLATIYKKGANEYCGFQISSIYSGAYKGLGINEGYTQLLANRYFKKTNPSYPIEETIVWFIEKLIGKEKMEELYFNCDLNGLMEQIKKYTEDASLVMFNWELETFSSDFYLTNEYDDHIIFYLDEFFKNVGEFLVNCFIQKIKFGEINKEEVKNYIDYLNRTIKISTIDFEFKFVHDKEKYLNEIDNIKSNKK